jgi:hypothetical protein
MTTTPGRTLPLILAAIALSAVGAAAQTLPWPGQGPAAQPGMAAPGPAMAPMPGPMMGPGPMQPAQPAPQQAAPNQACFEEFTKLRADVEKLGANTKAAGERKAPREEMCKAVQAFAVAEGKWVKFTNDNAARCGMPADLPKKLREIHAQTLTARKNICAAGPAGPAGPAAPSLSDALGTNRLPVPDGSQGGRGTFDTLTGNAIAR